MLNKLTVVTSDFMSSMHVQCILQLGNRYLKKGARNEELDADKIKYDVNFSK